MNHAAVTIQRWYRHHAKRRHANQAALKRILDSKRKVSMCPCRLSHSSPFIRRNINWVCLSPCFAAALKQSASLLSKEWEERTEEERRLEQQQRKDEDRKRIREEKARLARLAAIQVLTSDYTACGSIKL